jgi:hypothetical protein
MRPLTGGIPRIVFIVPLPDIPRISDKTGLREWGCFSRNGPLTFKGSLSGPLLCGHPVIIFLMVLQDRRLALAKMIVSSAKIK